MCDFFISTQTAAAARAAREKGAANGGDSDDTDGNNMDNNGDNEEDNPVTPRNAKGGGDAQADAGEERNALLRNLTQSVSAIANRGREGCVFDPSNPQHAWALLLALKVIEMLPAARERFKLRVDQMAFDELQAQWDN